MRKSFVVAGSVVIAVGIVLLASLVRSREQWNLAASRVLQQKNSFSVHLTPGYYRISATGGEASFPYTGSASLLQIVDSHLTQIDDIAEGKYEYFWINSSDNYEFYFINWYPMPNNTMSVRIDVRTYKIELHHPNSFVAPTGVVVCLAGLGVLVCGLIVKRRLPVKPPSLPLV